MKKWTILIVMMFVLVQIASAIELCEDRTDPNVACRMATPSLTCSEYNYSIINVNGIIINNSVLTALNGSIYYFNFSQGAGDYVVRLCDNSTREVYVQNSELKTDMATIAIAILTISAMFFFVYLANNFSARDDQGNIVPLAAMAKITLYALSGYMAFFSIQMALGISTANSLSQQIESNLASIYHFATVMMVLLMTILVFGIIGNVMYRGYLWLKKRFEPRKPGER